MASYFLDSSALVKLYHPETGSEIVQRLFGEAERRILVSRLSIVEVSSAFAGKLRMQAITDKEWRLLLARLKADVAEGLIGVFALTEFHYQLAEQIVARHRLRQRLRTLDSLQLAVALDLNQQGLCDTFVAADNALCEIASLEQLRVLNPEVDCDR